MPFYNRQDYLEESLKSVESQSYTNWELIAVDDGSTDGSVQLIAKFSAENSGKVLLVYSTEKRSGPAMARNLGLKVAKGDYVIFLDSDDLLEPYCLENRVSTMQNETHLSFAIFLLKTFEKEAGLAMNIFNRRPSSGDSYLNMFLRNDTPWGVHSAVWRKETITKLNGFDPQFYVMEDPDLHIRALLDSELQYRVCWELPPDSLYRLGNMDGEKEATFYHDSIMYRFKFLKKSFSLVSESILQEHEKKLALKNWLRGVENLFRHFLLSRIKQFEEETNEFLDWAACNSALTSTKQIQLRLMVSVWKSNSVIIKKTRVRGFIYQLFNYKF